MRVLPFLAVLILAGCTTATEPVVEPDLLLLPPIPPRCSPVLGCPPPFPGTTRS